MSRIDRMMKISTIRMILFTNMLYFTIAWYPPNHAMPKNTDDHHFHRSMLYESNRGYTNSKYADEPSVEQVKTVHYHGNKYIHVLGLKLPYYQAESYCNQAFPSESHLTSIQSEDEWKILSKHFGSSEPNKIWLGGFAELVSYQYVVLRWIDRTPFEYNRFSLREKERWRQILQKTFQGCIVSDIQKNGQGEWSLQSMPCDEPKEFICKESNFHNPMKLLSVNQLRSRNYRKPHQSHVMHKHREPSFSILPLSDDSQKVKVPMPKKLVIAKVSNEQEVPLPTVNTQTTQTLPTPPQVQPTPTNKTLPNPRHHKHRVPLKVHHNKKTMMTTNNTADQDTKKPDTNIDKNRKRVKFIIIGPNGQKTEVLENNINLQPGQILEPGTLDTNSGPLTIYLQGVSVPGN
ncbi:unnamed protein product [Trichobilharzia szidati]|nr:unnamed protein product [Trichobilharzia szidati]